MAYISHFPLNFVSLGYLQKRDFDCSHRSGKISKNNQIIGYIRFHGNDYEISNDENGRITFATLASDTATQKNIQPYQGPHSASTSDTCHRRIGYISLLGLHLLDKKCLEVRLRGKRMSQCIHYTLSKISQQLSRCSPSNQSTRPFHRVYIDWLDLEDS